MVSIMSESLCYCFALVALVIMTRPGDAADDSLQLEVTLTGDSPTQMVNIRCTFDPNLAAMDTVDELSIYGSRPNSKKDSFQSLASVDRWNTTPQLFGSLAIGPAQVTGSFGFDTNMSVLNMAWPLGSQPQGDSLRYKCAAWGTDRSGQPVTRSETTQLLADSGDTDMSQSQSTDTNLDTLTDDVRNTLASLDARLTALEDKVNTGQDMAGNALSQLEQKIDDLGQGVGDTFQSFGNAMKDTGNDFSSLKDDVEQLKKTQQHLTVIVTLLGAEKDFKLTNTNHNGKLYMVSKEDAYFNIDSANSRCMSYMGYLAEIKDSYELQFVADFLEEIDGDMFFIGANDRIKEGTFTYYHRGDKAPNNLWGLRRPTSNKNDEDCVRIDVADNILVSVSCDDHKVKYVCEIPFDQLVD